MMKTTLLALIVATTAAQAAPETQSNDMQMPADSAPSSARDPHAYSDGYTLTTGPYAQSGLRQLVLADEQLFWAVLGNRLEYQPDSDTGVYDLQGWLGNSYDRLVVKAEGDIANSRLEESSTELLWSHAVSTYFDTQVGVQYQQFDEGENRPWLAMGIQGLAPYWFELDITGYLGEQGRTALSAEIEYELLLTQKLILQPRAELTLYGKDDPQNGLGAGLANVSVGLRLRYEFSRQFAPYLGVEWSDASGKTADLMRQRGQSPQDTQFLTGVRFWF
ncbi:copper resistance protein B [Shewanella sp. GXUN23E]|uniref:copper resistance protein B n=1 Tax=Shewanella sp. GXUN23E TaxID=3422498 RepID=UPI003D7ED660